MKLYSKIIGVVLVALLSLTTVHAQKVAAKTNLLYWAAAGSPNAAVEFKIAPRWTADIYAGGNLWKLPQQREFRHLLAQPELRYWFCEAFDGLFIGLHGHGAKFNVGNWNIPVGRLKVLKDRRWEGYLYGGGLSLGYQWVLSKHLNLETSLGGGYARVHYREYPCTECGNVLSEGTHDYLGVTRATLSLVYFFK